MSNIIKKVVFLLVLAGLLTWGVATLAGAPSINATVSQNGTVLHGQTIEQGVPADRSQIHPR